MSRVYRLLRLMDLLVPQRGKSVALSALSKETGMTRDDILATLHRHGLIGQIDNGPVVIVTVSFLKQHCRDVLLSLRLTGS